MNTEIKKQLSVLELSDLVAVIEAQEKEVSFVDLTYNERLEHLLCNKPDHYRPDGCRENLSCMCPGCRSM